MMLLHAGLPIAPHDLWRAWSGDPAVVGLLLGGGIAYAAGTRRLWRAAGRGHGITTWQTASFAVGLFVLGAALVSPLHALGGVLFSAHMAQHTLLVVVAAPLLVLGRPLVPLLWALPLARRRHLANVARLRSVSQAWHALTRPLNAWLVHAAALWIWHAPALYGAAITSELAHAAQHTSLLGSALLFWYAVLEGARRRSYGSSALYVFGTALHSAALGAILTLSNALWYPEYASTTALWGVTPVRDQQLAGWIMWVPAGCVYLAVMLALLALWLRESEVRVARREAGLIASLFLMVALLGCSRHDERAEAMIATGGTPDRGAAAIRQYGCGACHTIEGIPGAQAHVGPDLTGIAMRAYIGGAVENSPENLVRWISNPKDIDPQTAMPYLGVSPRDARDIAAYLYSLR
jgi:putative membrane protein